MTEAERRAAWEAAVTEVFEKIDDAYQSAPGNVGVVPPESQRKILEAIANVRALHEMEVDAEPGQYSVDVAASHMTDERAVVDPNDVADPVPGQDPGEVQEPIG